MDDLVGRMNAVCDGQPFRTHWFLRDLATGRSAHRDGHTVVPSASTRKIAVLASALAGVNEGRFTLDQQVEIQAKYQDNDSGTFQHLTPGFKITFRDALVMMIIVSDNTCTGMVVDMVGLDKVNALSRAAGMVGTTHRHNIPPRLQPDHPVEATNATTAADVGGLLELILRGTSDPGSAARLGGTPALCKLAIDILSWQKMKTRIPALLPLGAKVAHKTGTAARGYNDAGIIFVDGEPRFILSCYTDGVPRELPNGLPGYSAACDTIARLARLCYDEFSQSKAAAEPVGARA